MAELKPWGDGPPGGLLAFSEDEACRYGMPEAVLLETLRRRHHELPGQPPVFLLTPDRRARWWPWWDDRCCKGLLTHLADLGLLIHEDGDFWRLSDAEAAKIPLETRP